MKGRVLSFYTQQNQGAILGEDGRQYSFMGTHWQEQVAPREDDQVEFAVDATGQVTNITYDTTATSAINLDKPQQSAQPQYATGHSHTTQEQPTLDNVYASPTSQVSPSPTYNSAQDALYAEEEGYNMIDWTKKCMSNYVNFNGRARRKEYWFFYLAQILISMAIGAVLGIISGAIGTDLTMMSNLVGLIFLLPTLAVGSRRLHDIGKSGWWQLLWLVPIIGWILLIVWFATDTTPEVNQWGAPARRV
ncbi:DUF805 domain-containing protein [Psychrobacter sp. I-STPA10]|uniref:DUF805 domain-containing protein n=1 Tax=Psychrobacter sp. I-STPA10 TaxID=2585769 RepID=UPI001E60829A|nr:DUF805 domain-containing protein [Psychrobacter sp. I-STPA10]